MNPQAKILYDKYITKVKVDNFLGYVPTDRHHERLAVEQMNDSQGVLVAMKLVKATANYLTFTGMKPKLYEEFRKVAGY